ETTQVSNSKKSTHFYPVGIKIMLNNGITLSSVLPPVNQEIRSMKWGAWMGYSMCQLTNETLPEGAARNTKKGSLKIVLL
ncbi:MAG: hypothetical protein ACHQF2_12235, partial [Flavobacteriales bacterium]